MKFIADLHIHSKYSRATAKNLDFENLYYSARIKGLSVVGTGDFTFPAWVEEIETKLEPAEPGLFALKPEIAREIDRTLPEKCKGEVRFILQTEISNIYKKEGRVRKNHNLVYFPDLESVKRFNLRLDSIGNIKSDGRPILGLDAADLLEIMLEINDQGFFVPAHIWTPWFSMFGSKSGFDSMEECFGPLKKHIFAVETGLSSDPPMNWRVADLDPVRLISNSDAHSPGYLGRNATLFDTDLDYFSMKKALETNDPERFLGTYDMHPHQGKYHYDGHRKCNISLNPARTAELDNICPQCGRPLTLGVLYRVQELANRPEGYAPENRHGYTSIIPLKDILSEVFGVGPNTKKVAGAYDKAIEALGPELGILTDRSEEEIEKAGVPLLAGAVMKMRRGDVLIDPGYDGEYGRVRLFSREERQSLKGEKDLSLVLPPSKKSRAVARKARAEKPEKKKRSKPVSGKSGLNKAQDPGLIRGLNPEQKKAVESEARAVLIQAGPGTGKTRTLTARIAWLVSEKKKDPSSILALTFTNKAAGELARRIEKYMPGGKGGVMSATFHGFCLKFLKEQTGFTAGLADDDLKKELVRKAIEKLGQTLENPSGKPPGKRALGRLALRAGDFIARCKQQLLNPDLDFSQIPVTQDLAGEISDEPGGFEILPRIYRVYQALCREMNLVDYEELIFQSHNRLKDDPELLGRIRDRFEYIFIDEYQDLNLGQYELVKLLAGKGNLLVIGDPDQSIYGFRGSDHRYFNRFEEDFPGCEKFRLKQNYRSTQTILDASCQMISRPDPEGQDRKIFSNLDTGQRLIIREAATETAEAVAAGKVIESLMGGLSFFSMDARIKEGAGSDPGDGKEYSFSDFAVLCRTKRQLKTFVQVFQKEGIPFQAADKGEEFGMEGIREMIGFLKYLGGRAGEREREDLGAWLQKNPGLVPASGSKGIGPALEEIKGRLAGLTSSACLENLKEWMDLGRLLGEKDEVRTAYARLSNLADIHADPGDLLDSLALDQDPDHLADSAEKVSLMTIHAAKGLEFPVVFVAGCEQGLIPFARDGKTCDDPEEERRLFYVAMTRAMDILYLTYARKRRIYGTVQKRERSLFLDDIERRLTRTEQSRIQEKAKPKQIQLELF
ncbi:UvrD-helicase domain-containing protein [Desulfospira joergensenii]|uniref:UvrD-helicase domain-containing protein n=1 Tax=Desulfospira joergensenii TaxID=53329 RepID=UPI00047F0CA8|nr:UvrD-helicase domain-containing protein [Desulfospira joergensenii]